MQNARLRQRPVNQPGQQQLRDSVSAWDDVRAHAIGSPYSDLRLVHIWQALHQGAVKRHLVMGGQAQLRRKSSVCAAVRNP